MHARLAPGSFFMLIVKKINNNVALAQAPDGSDLVVFGKGIGFPATPYELEDTSSIQTVFHHVDNEVLTAVSSIKPEVMTSAVEIAGLAADSLDCELNRNLFLTLADHLQFAIERFEDGIFIENPLASTVRAIYPKEYEVGEKGIAIVRDHCDIELPSTEACSIAMHIVTAEAGTEFDNDLHDFQKTMRSIDEVTDIVEECLGIEIDRASYNYNRFAIHLRYLIKRLSTGEAVSSQNKGLFARIASDFPEVSACTGYICDYLKERYGRTCGNEERLYLMMYLNRFLVTR